MVITLPIRQGCIPKPHIRRRRKYRQPVAQVIRLDSGPSKAEAYALYLQASELDETDPIAAIPVYERALSLDPALALAMVNMGNCYHRTARKDMAVKYYEQALAIDPDQCEGLYNLGYCHMQENRSAEAVELFKRSLTADPTFSDAWYSLAMAYEQLGMARSALPVQHAYRRCVALGIEPEYRDLARARIAR